MMGRETFEKQMHLQEMCRKCARLWTHNVIKTTGCVAQFKLDRIVQGDFVGIFKQVEGHAGKNNEEALKNVFQMRH
jgi:hypothetical protein